MGHLRIFYLKPPPFDAFFTASKLEGSSSLKIFPEVQGNAGSRPVAVSGDEMKKEGEDDARANPDIVGRTGFLVMGTVTASSPGRGRRRSAAWNELRPQQRSSATVCIRSIMAQLAAGADGSFDYLTACVRRARRRRRSEVRACRRRPMPCHVSVNPSDRRIGTSLASGGRNPVTRRRRVPALRSIRRDGYNAPYFFTFPIRRITQVRRPNRRLLCRESSARRVLSKHESAVLSSRGAFFCAVLASRVARVVLFPMVWLLSCLATCRSRSARFLC